MTASTTAPAAYPCALTRIQQLDLAVVLIEAARECYAQNNPRGTALYLRAASRMLQQLLEVTP